MTLHMGHLALRVPDPHATAKRTAEILSLTVRESSDADSVLLSSNDKHHELQFLPGTEAALDHIGLEVDTVRELDALYDHLVAQGAEIVEREERHDGLGRSFRVSGPASLVFEIYHGMRRDPLSLPLGLRGPVRKYGHITLFSPERAEIEEFLKAALGFRVSDTLGGRITWLRCDDDHHGIAVGDGVKNQLHHYAFELTDWGSMRSFLDHLSNVGGRAVYGPVRHGPGFSISTYLPDPDGCLIEAYTELARIDNDETYVPVDWSTVEGARNLWGAESDGTFHEIGIPIGSGARGTAEPTVGASGTPVSVPGR
jgi:catechol 2,3-dioxygenase-like lactoylglutathione lyase family enzyme